MLLLKIVLNATYIVALEITLKIIDIKCLALYIKRHSSLGPSYVSFSKLLT